MAALNDAYAHDDPQERCWGHHTWSDLVFLHWGVPPELVQAQLPHGLQAEIFDGAAWIGLVAFGLSQIQPRWSPVPLLGKFHEVNVRTYVRAGDHGPGVWFFSMDAASRFAVQVARWRWNFNYRYARVGYERTGSRICLQSNRRVRSGGDVGIHLTAECQAESASLQCSALTQFLTEQYRYYSLSHAGPLCSGQVAHPPYRVRPLAHLRLTQSLTHAAGIPVAAPPDHACYCAGVRAQVFSPLPMRTTQARTTSSLLPAQHANDESRRTAGARRLQVAHTH